MLSSTTAVKRRYPEPTRALSTSTETIIELSVVEIDISIGDVTPILVAISAGAVLQLASFLPSTATAGTPVMP